MDISCICIYRYVTCIVRVRTSPHFFPYLRMGYCITRIRISCTFVPNVLTTEKSNNRIESIRDPGHETDKDRFVDVEIHSSF